MTLALTISALLVLEPRLGPALADRSEPGVDVFARVIF